MVLEPIESTIQLSTLKCINHTDLPTVSNDITRYSSLKRSKRIPRIIGKRGTRNTEFVHPSSLAYSKQDELICKFDKFIFLFT